MDMNLESLISAAKDNVELAQSHQKQAELDSLEAELESLSEQIGEPEGLLAIDEAEDIDQKLYVLRYNIQTYKDHVTNPEPAQQKYGKHDGPVVMFSQKGQSPIWIDVNGINIDSGQPVKITPYVQKKIDQARADWGGKEFKKSERKKQPHEVYRMTEAEYELELDKEHPVFALPVQDGPKWDDSILYGVTGDIIRKASQHCEAHPAGMLVDLLVSLGSIIGRSPYFNVNGTQHFANEYLCRVGPSSTGRKGTGRDQIDEILKLLDHKWYIDRVKSGFGSGESIVNEVRDSFVELRQIKPGGAYHDVAVRGIDDKRLCVRDGELSALFTLCGKEGIASEIVRNGWDSKVLRNTVKGKDKNGVSNSTKCEQPHVSISGDTTLDELRLKLPEGAAENGFANRFLYVYVYRVKMCPNGGPQINWNDEILALIEIIQRAKTIKLVPMTESARKWWNRYYFEVENNRPEGLVGKVTARGAAHVRRIAMLYALLDVQLGIGGDQIDTEHFIAAKKLWDYCEESAQFIFGGGLTKERLRILKWVEKHESATYQQIRDDMYNRNRSVEQIKSDLASLVQKKRLVLNGQNYQIKKS